MISLPLVIIPFVSCYFLIDFAFFAEIFPSKIIIRSIFPHVKAWGSLFLSYIHSFLIQLTFLFYKGLSSFWFIGIRLFKSTWIGQQRRHWIIASSHRSIILRTTRRESYLCESERNSAVKWLTGVPIWRCRPAFVRSNHADLSVPHRLFYR